MTRRFQFFNTTNLNPTRFVVVGFLAIILTGAFLLWLPISSRTGEYTSPLVCLFTATSATCVTGLVQVDTYQHWTFFGQAVILVLIQLGGLGFVSLITLVALVMRQRIGLAQRMIMASALNLNGTAGVVRVVRHALIGTFALEGIGAVLLATRFVPMFGWVKGIWFGIFHSISAFCNAGFDLLGGYSQPFGSLLGFEGDPLVLFTIMILIVCGGLGFFVWEDVFQSRNWKKLTLYSKMALAITAALIVFGFLFILLAEWGNPGTLGALPIGQRFTNALFQSVTLRTAGYATLNQGMLLDSTIVMCIILMLVGGSSGSTAGGIKTVTMGILLLSVRDGMRGRSEVVVRGRTIPQNRVLNAMTLTIVVILLFITGSMALTMMEGLPFLDAAFEVASAMGTVGLSVGITPDLSAVSTMMITLLMFLGRVGILSFSIAFLNNNRTVNKIRYPSVDVLVG